MTTTRPSGSASPPGAEGLSPHAAHGTDIGVVAVSALCMGLGASLGFMPGFIATELRSDLGISRGEVGLLVSLYFGCTGLGSILAGRITERLGARIVIALDMMLVTIAAVFSATVGTFWALLVAAVIAGSGYALANAGTNVAIGRAVPVQRRTLAMSIKTAGVPAMAVIAAALGSWSAQRWSWQAIYLVIAGFAAFAVVAALVTFADDRPVRVGAPRKGPLPAGYIWFAVGAFLLIAGSQPLYSWIVPYLEQSLDAGPALAGGISAFASAVGVGLMVVNALRTDRLGADRRVSRIMTLLAINAGATVLVLLGNFVGIGVVVVGVVVGISAQLASIGTMHAVVVDRAPGAVARATGLTMTGYYLGALFSPVAFGILADLTDTFAYSWAATAVLLLLAIPVWARAGRVPIPTPAARP